MLCISTVLCFFESVCLADARNEIPAEFRRLVLPFYSPKSSQPAVVVRVGISGTDYLQRGFIKIGLFPIRVLDGVHISVRDSGYLHHALREITRRFAGRSKMRGLELRNVVIESVAGESKWKIMAGRIVHLGENRWEIASDARLNRNGIETRYSSALLSLEESAVRLWLPVGRGNPPRIITLFSKTNQGNQENQ